MSKHNGDKKVVEISKSLIEDSNDRDNVSSIFQSQIKSSFECILCFPSPTFNLNGAF